LQLHHPLFGFGRHLQGQQLAQGLDGQLEGHTGPQHTHRFFHGRTHLARPNPQGLVLELTQLGRKLLARCRRQPLEQQVPALLVALTKVGGEERFAQDALAVHDHLVHLVQRRFRPGDELEALAAETQGRQRAVEVGQLLPGILDLLAQAVDKAFDQLLLGQGPLLGDARPQAAESLVLPARRGLQPGHGGLRLLRQALEHVEVVKDEATSLNPNPLAYADVASGTTNQVLTPGDGALLTGYRLRYDPADPAQGIFLVAADGAATRVERFIKLLPGEVSLIAPALPAGTYTLEVRANVTGNGEIRSGKLKAPLTVS
jgi:hypothetical protein